MSVEVLNAGLLTTIQDNGRFGFQNSGISPSGVMDHQAYNAALSLVSAQKSVEEIVNGSIPDAVLEATLFGPTLKFHDEAYFAITGADMDPHLDDQKIPMYQTIHACAGQILRMGFAKNGCRSYVAFSGGITVPVVMGSRSTNLKCQLGGYQGRALMIGDILPVSSKNVSLLSHKQEIYADSVTLRVIDGPQDDYFTDKAKETLYSSVYTVSELSDRMGYRLDGSSLESINGVDIISDGITFGSIQVPPNGKPIILLADRQTTGGYAKIGTVLFSDISRLVQLKPGCKIRFERMDINEL